MHGSESQYRGDCRRSGARVWVSGSGTNCRWILQGFGFLTLAAVGRTLAPSACGPIQQMQKNRFLERGFFLYGCGGASSGAISVRSAYKKSFRDARIPLRGLRWGVHGRPQRATLPNKGNPNGQNFDLFFQKFLKQRCSPRLAPACLVSERKLSFS